MITIKILGPYPSCTLCDQAEVECRKAAASLGDQVKIEHLDVMTAEFGQYKGMVPPVILIGNELVSTGKVLPADQVVEIIKYYRKG